ncbi:tRNA(Ile2) 2-agmatinylcytidine synthetase [Methanoregula sp.]|uniref:tRNA(Ile2) 2-agmatinylcytidine synthetase n=1 Tax=Methanoregula sp. TaxID=2052170 RepID=UPI002B69885F|nr:tRNA(Ile2) 2-agmatinylcytidine synthetase [Methanoregula sp.]HVP97493.1 tRNA(Ile2) 2-agmatinylcytidine synthetase [Methanoregula sp.]
MITLTPDDVKTRFGSLFSKKFLVMVDETAGRAEILEQCHARGTIEWDAMNRSRAGGAVAACAVEGSTMTIQARLGRYPVNFGAAAGTIGGQALEAVEIDGDEVITTWAGIAGAGVGIAACLPQAPGVLRAEYPTEEDLKIGGARTNHVRIITPRYEKISFGIDDTDTRQEGATWVMALQCAEACHIDGVEFLNMRLVQLNPAVPDKTTNCVGSALNFAARPGSIGALCEFVRGFVEKHTFSEDTGIAFSRGIRTGQDSPFHKAIKTEILSVQKAEEEARRLGIEFLDHKGRKGRIGALGAVLWADRGIEAAGLYGEHL